MANYPKTFWKKGDWNVLCDQCGRKRKRSECELSYDKGNLAVYVTCRDTCSDERHPLNDPPPIYPDGLPVPDGRPDYIASNPALGYTTGFLVGGQSTTSSTTVFHSKFKWGTLWPGKIWSATNSAALEGFGSLVPLNTWGNFI